MRMQTLAEGRWIFAILALLLIVSFWFSAWWSLLFFILFLYTLAFFRDPDRIVPGDSNSVVAAADGKITDIVEVEETDVLKTKMLRVGIFLSIFDVHTNRAP
ncbi:MAG: phosphatidylserine decarboxylase, partial [Verrucomicrobiota bacterium]